MAEHGWRDLFGLWPPPEERGAPPPLTRSRRAAALRAIRPYAWIPKAGRERLLRLAAEFLASKDFEGCSGFQVTDAARAAVAARGCVLLLGMDAPAYPSLRSVLLYPSSFLVPCRERGPDGVMVEGPDGRRGQAGLGVVILAWDSAGAGKEPGEDLVLHEFAHQLASETGALDGVPRLRDRASEAAWRSKLSAAHRRLAADVARGRPSFLRPYGAKNLAEFFAVLTEAFFTAPADLKRGEPGLYGALLDFYRQDPAATC